MNTSGDELYATSVESLSERVHRYTVSHRGGTTLLRWDEVLELWRTDRSFALFFTAMLAASPFESFFWECPASSYATLSAPFECVTIRASTFARANPANFAEHFNAGMGAATFLSLGGDATLVAPTGLVGAGLVGAGLVGAPGEARASYGHIAAFCRGASESQHLAVWQAVGTALAAHNSASGGRPVWLSTEGSGVPWLHIRMDSRPKYYHLPTLLHLQSRSERVVLIHHALQYCGLFGETRRLSVLVPRVCGVARGARRGEKRAQGPLSVSFCLALQTSARGDEIVFVS